MATYTSSKAVSGVQPKGLTVGLVAVTSTYTTVASAAAGDIIQMVKVPKGATPVHVNLTGAPADGHIVVKVGDGVSTGRYITGGTLSIAGVGNSLFINTEYVPYTYSVDDTIDIKLSVLSISATAIGTVYNLIAIFSMDT